MTTPGSRAMAEVLLEYDRLLCGDDGRAYRARAWGGAAHDGTGRWHGWVEFVPIEGGSPVRTARETTQPDRTCTVYWSTGLTRVYLEGALERALRLADAIRTNSFLELTSFDRWFLKSLVIAPG